MKEEKKESPIGVLWVWGKPYHGKFIGSVILRSQVYSCKHFSKPICESLFFA